MKNIRQKQRNTVQAYMAALENNVKLNHFCGKGHQELQY